MNEPEVDDVAFLTGENAKKQVLYSETVGHETIRRITCSKQEACGITAGVLIVLFIISLIAAFARPVPKCPIIETEMDSQVSTLKPTETLPISKTGEIFPWQDIRLPPFISPLEYKLFMHPNLTTFENTGNVKITFVVTAQTDFIVLHSKDLTLTRTVVLHGENNELPVKQVLEYPKHEQLYVKVGQLLKPGESYVLWIDFKKKLEEKLEGFYISSYKTSDGEKKYLATTHFEPTYARNAFPCFDEPAMKAKFQLSIIHKENYNAYFNTEIENVSVYSNGLKITVFQKTVQMSTYLVAFVVCDFKEKQRESKGGIKIRVIVPSEQLNQADFALNTAAEILYYFETFFNIKYPLSKLDMIAIPDFAAGAMENWGLITFRMTAILYNDRETSSDSQEQVAIVIAHELAHQWFGNLVTMNWWSDLWLNEGFASFMEYLGISHVQPNWKMMDQFIVSTTQNALSLDSLESSHSIMTDVKDPMEIESIFDAVSYTKGAAILYMLEDSLGMETMKEGLSTYLNKYRFKNAKTEDLWNSFTEVAMKSQQMNVSKIMDTWTLQKGYPILYVTNHKSLVVVKQKRFLLAPPDRDVADPSDISPYGYKWFVPASYITDNDQTKKTIWLNMTDGEFFLPSECKWLKFNVRQTGFYRVMYDDSMWEKLISQLQTNHSAMHPADRANLIDDAFTLCRVGILKSHYAMDLSKYLEKEDDYVPWEAAILSLDFLHSIMQENPALTLYEKYVLKTLKPIVKLLGWEDTGDHLKKKLRSNVLSMSMKYNDEETVKEARKLFSQWMNEGKSVPPNLRRVVYQAGVKYGGKEEWQFCWKRYQETQIPSEKRLLLSALGHTQDLWQLTQYLNYSLDKNKIRPQDTTSVIAVASQNPIGRLITWRFVRMNWPQLLTMFGQGSFSMDTIISVTISHFSTKFDYNEVKSFFSTVEVASGMRSLQQSLERIRTNIHWKENTEASLIQWLQQNI